MAIEQDNIKNLAEKYGTPLYLYEEQIIKQRLESLQKAFSAQKCTIHYAVKANSNLSLLKYFNDQGCGFDIVSEGELLRLLEIGCDPKRIVFSGVGKTKSEIKTALEAGILMFNVESLAELRVLSEAANSLSKVAPIALRVNPDINADLHPYVATGLYSTKFGIPVEDLDKILAEVKKLPALSLIGIDCHIGSGIDDITPLIEAYTELRNLAERLKSEGFSIEIIDLGGGFGNKLDFKLLKTKIDQTFNGISCKLIIEPGKFLIMEAGTLITEVIYLKENQGKRFIIVDAGMNDLIRPALYEAYHEIQVLGDKAGKKAVFDVVGPVCESGCFFAHDRELPEPKAGDLLLIKNSGAYGFTMASNYNTRRLPAEVMIDENGNAKLIRKRQEYKALWQEEKI